MRQPKGFEDGTSHVCLLIHSLYGLKQSGRAWNKTLDMHLKTLGYQQLNADHCVYIQQPDHGVYDIFSMWVDDFTLFFTKGRISQNKREIWEIMDQGNDLHIIVGIQIIRDWVNKQITIHQGAYIQCILECFGMANSDTVATPMDNTNKLTIATEDDLFEHPTLY